MNARSEKPYMRSMTAIRAKFTGRTANVSAATSASIRVSPGIRPRIAWSSRVASRYAPNTRTWLTSPGRGVAKMAA